MLTFIFYVHWDEVDDMKKIKSPQLSNIWKNSENLGKSKTTWAIKLVIMIKQDFLYCTLNLVVMCLTAAWYWHKSLGDLRADWKTWQTAALLMQQQCFCHMQDGNTLENVLVIYDIRDKERSVVT